MNLYQYYSLLSNGFLDRAELNAPGFIGFDQKRKPLSNIPAGVVANRSWRDLTEITPLWRMGLSKYYQSDFITQKMRSLELRPIVFSDVDYAIINRDAQGHVDQYVADRATLESLGFISLFYFHLKNPHMHLSEIKAMSNTEQSFSEGQRIFKDALTEIENNQIKFVAPKDRDAFYKISAKPAYELTDDDYKEALSIVEDSFYKLIIDPITFYINGRNNVRVSSSDVHNGLDRMNIIYTTHAAFSHSQIANKDEMIRHKFFGDFDAGASLFEGIPEFFEALRNQGVEVVAITRGNQFPYLENSGSQMGQYFDRIHSTLISAKRNSPDLDPIYPHKKIRSYSMVVDNLSTTDKIRVMISEALHKFNEQGFKFESEQEILDAVGTYLDRCVFITDSDLEVWGTCPTVEVMALRTPNTRDLNRVYSQLSDIPKPIAVINPQNIHGPLNGFSTKDVIPNFDPSNVAISQLIQSLCQGASIRPQYTPSNSLARSLR